jgi:hypothetical protein
MGDGGEGMGSTGGAGWDGFRVFKKAPPHGMARGFPKALLRDQVGAGFRQDNTDLGEKLELVDQFHRFISGHAAGNAH